MDGNDELIEKWIKSRTLANGMYSIYKDLRQQDETYGDIVYEQLHRQLGLTEDDSKKAVTAIRAIIDQITKGKK